MKARRNVRGLIKALYYDKYRFEDGWVRARASEVLSEIGKSSMKPLIVALRDSSNFVHQRAATGWAITTDGTVSALWKTTDGGETWAKLSPTLVP